MCFNKYVIWSIQKFSETNVCLSLKYALKQCSVMSSFTAAPSWHDADELYILKLHWVVYAKYSAVFYIYVSLLLFSVLCGYKCACKIRYIKFALSFSETHFKVFVGLWLSMMGALGNGRRGGRSPSLLVAALIACVLLLGFNYWVSNSRNSELQVLRSVIRCSLWRMVKWVAVNYNLLFVVL